MKQYKNFAWFIIITAIIPEFNTVNVQTVQQQTCPISMTLPAQNASMKQVRIDGGKVQTNWVFKWTRCPSATRYHLYVIGPGALNPIVNKDDIHLTTYTDRAIHYGITSLTGWTCKIRAFENGAWGDWSEIRTFNVMPVPSSVSGIITYPANWGNKERVKFVELLNQDGSVAQRATVRNNRYTFLNVTPGVRYKIRPYAFGTVPEEIPITCTQGHNYINQNFRVFRLPISEG